MVDGGPFVIVTEETWSQLKTRMFIVHGSTIDELTNVSSYYEEKEGKYCLLVFSDSAQLDIEHSGRPDYWTPRACYVHLWGVDPIRLELLTPEQCHVDLGEDGSVQRVVLV